MCVDYQTDKLYHDKSGVPYAFNTNGEKARLNPNLVDVCACESSYPGGKETPRHYEKDKTTVRYGRVTPGDTGLCQINKPINGWKAQELGYEIEKPYGNIKMANYLYEKYGLSPWSASGMCWK